MMSSADPSSANAPTSTNEPQFAFSSSVMAASSEVRPREPISAAAFAQAIFKVHPEYAQQKAGSLTLDKTPSERKTQEWLDDAKTLFDPGKVKLFSKADSTPMLHGRQLVIGLSLLDPALREQLERSDAFAALVNELKEPLEEILSERGRQLYHSFKPAQQQPELLDTVPNWSDDPLLKPEEDLLGRRAFARFLATRIAGIRPDSGAYSLHVYGPWGAGKSTLLNFLRQELEGKRAGSESWLVVEFNAWRQQQIQPPWWSLMERIFQRTRSRLSRWEKFQEYWWRFSTGRLHYILAVVGLAWLLVGVVLLVRHKLESPGLLKGLGADAENISKILALIATVWGAMLAMNRSLLLGAARAAQNYNELTHDPTNQIKRRFNDLIEKLRPERVVILIDDLDRCQSHYVVDLLEGIQTLFREAPVVFVVAADRQWLNACYEEVYEKLESRVNEPGKPLGTLFLEKAFRFSTPMPGIPEGLKESYWDYLLQLTGGSQEGAAEIAQARQSAREQVGRAQSEGDVRNLVASSGNLKFAEQRALREEAVVRLASPEIIQRIEHTLRAYAKLMEPNPRAMKLLVNSYSANRALAILSEVEIELPQLALWTILCSRWPQLADYLAEHPELVGKIGEPGLDGLPDDLKALCQEPSVVQVLKGGSTGGGLTVETLKLCSRMRA